MLFPPVFLWAALSCAILSFDAAYGAQIAGTGYVDSALSLKLDKNSVASGRARAYTTKADGTQENRGIFGSGFLMSYGPAGGGDYNNPNPAHILTFYQNSAEAGLSYTSMDQFKTTIGLQTITDGTERSTGRTYNGKKTYIKSFSSAQASIPGAVLVKKADEWAETIGGPTVSWSYEYTKD
jgi:hypothetical protein